MLTSIALDHLGAWFHRTPDPQTGLWPFTGPTGREIRNRFILARLDEPVLMSFANETPLEDVLKYIKAAPRPQRQRIPDLRRSGRPERGRQDDEVAREARRGRRPLRVTLGCC